MLILAQCNLGYSRQAGSPHMHLAHVPDAGALHVLIAIPYTAALVYGLHSDIRNFTLPNAVSLALAALFFLHCWLFATSPEIGGHLLTGGCALLAGFAIYAAGVMGAGDVKLIGALMLWAGPRDASAFLMIMTLTGAVAAGLLLLTRTLMAVWPSTARRIPSRRFKNWASRGVFPYGIAICAAGLILTPSFLAPSH